MHHRQPRGMGGSGDPEQHSPANLVHLCRPCHRWIEANSTEAYEQGWKVRHGQYEPWEVPILKGTLPVYLNHDGSQRLPQPEED